MGRPVALVADHAGQAALNQEVLQELWVYMACKHACFRFPSREPTQLPSLLRSMQAARLGWREFWTALTELRDHGSALDDDTADALAVLLQRGANRRRFERHFEERRAEPPRAAGAVAGGAAAVAGASSGDAPAAADGSVPAGAPAAPRRRLHARRTGGTAAGGGGGEAPPPDPLASSTTPLQLFTWLCSSPGQGDAGDAPAAGAEADAPPSLAADEQRSLEGEKGPDEQADQQQHQQQQQQQQQQHQPCEPSHNQQQQQQQEEAAAIPGDGEQGAQQKEEQGAAPDHSASPTPAPAPFTPEGGDAAGSGESGSGGAESDSSFNSGSGSDDIMDWDSEDGSSSDEEGGGRHGGGGGRHGGPAPFEAVHDALTADDESLLSSVLALVPYASPLRDTAGSVRELRAAAARHPVPVELPAAVACGVASSGARLLLLHASSGLCLRSAAAAVALRLAGHELQADQPRRGLQRLGEQEAEPQPSHQQAEQHHNPTPSGSQQQRAAASPIVPRPPGRPVFAADLTGAWDDGDLEERLAAALTGAGVGDGRTLDVAEQLTGHLKLLGASCRAPMVLLLANADAALAMEGGAGLFELTRRALALLPGCVVIVSSSAEGSSFLADAVDSLPIAAAPERECHALPDGATLHATSLRLMPLAPCGCPRRPWEC
ncbi:hypothetical protein Rsub_09407 [Raphidocelis subcapitata]|uniref:Uncharacterized protein n=1 Tax=Raphidocelis subcapitata TaxID=307507 RepID=A0A2V0PGL0_9CHLO|nr:hypothetical protein Rsub_09407 [Raphidocelis subcapitata]|eukprot:GBF96337.1 hypothetical protein Rsub_09407 [Raphidocelis subcapitata]